MARGESSQRLTLKISVDIPGPDRAGLEALKAAARRNAEAAAGGPVRVSYVTVLLGLIREAAKKLEAA